MFTGIIQYVGQVKSIANRSGGMRMAIDLGPLADRLSIGASVAVNGACLTASSITAGLVEFDVVAQTLERTTLGDLATGSEVNLELPVAAGSPLDGHIVQGHVDGIAEVVRIDRIGGNVFVTLSAADELTGQMVPRGSAALTGVSLTLAGLERGRFSVALVPTTLGRTTLGKLRVADRLNLELDIIGKYVRRHLENLAGNEGRLTIETLRQAGFA